ncbi:hypothetical protein ISP15_17950 [Dyella jejuensis]|uniref:Uncharacterized protein n=1 Tax=Dyella jejuensis TaxID=1432009 RepID=A0ABW8JPK6_9GAMM
MKGMGFYLLVVLTLTVALSSCAQVGRPGSDQRSDRLALAAKAFPAQKNFLYVDVPAADNGVSNLMVRAFAGDSATTQHLTSIISRGAIAPTYVVVGSQSNGVAYSTVKAVLDGFKGKKLPYLHLALIGDSAQAGQLQPVADALHSEYLVLVLPHE